MTTLFMAVAIVLSCAFQVMPFPEVYAANVEVNGLSGWHVDTDGIEVAEDGTIRGVQAGPHDSVTGETGLKPYVYSRGSADDSAWDGWQWSRTGESEWKPVKEGSAPYYVLQTVLANLPSPAAASETMAYELLISTFVVGTPIEAITIPDGVTVVSIDASQIIGSCGNLEFSYSPKAFAVQPKKGMPTDTSLIVENIIEAMTKVYGAPMMVVSNGVAIWSNGAVEATYAVADGTIGVQKR
ncbi:MAG: hypothetical protein J6Z82_10680 [Schwartzia sp.]|nr:hypothetical protein [Schwartzia sp. (in: firmicutes)]